jgi:hypothetical protein
MPIFRTLTEILENPWKTVNTAHAELTGGELPPNYTWDYTNNIKYTEIDIWEQIYFQPGNIGVYAAHSPRIEMYIVVYHLFQQVEVFYGADSANKVWDRMSEFNIKLAIHNRWIDNYNLDLVKPLTPS